MKTAAVIGVYVSRFNFVLLLLMEFAFVIVIVPVYPRLLPTASFEFKVPSF